MSDFVSAVRSAIREGKLKTPFRAKDVKEACPGWAASTYSTYLSKHRVGNPGGYTAYFRRHEKGLYSLR